MNTKTKTNRRANCGEKILRRLVALLAILSTVLYAPTIARAQGTAFTYQGRLNDGPGPANGHYDLQFTVFDAASAGNIVGGPLTNAATAVSNGLFTVTLDFGQGAFPGADRWLEIGVITNGGGAFATLVPRQQVTSTPYAIQAASAASAATANSVAASNITGSLSPALLPSNLLTNNQSGVTLSGAFSGDGSGLGNLNVPLSNVNGALPNSASWSITGNSLGGFPNSVARIENTSAANNSAPALRVVVDGGNPMDGALSVSANIPPTTPGVVAEFGNAYSWVTTITNDGTIYAKGFVGDGGRLSNLNASQLSGVLTGNGAGLTNLNASQLTGGTLADALLSTNVALRVGGNTFSGSQQVVGLLSLGPESLDQQQTNSSSATTDYEFWQSFTAGQSGLLTRVALQVLSPLYHQNCPGTINIYAGQGLGGTLLASQPVTFQYVYHTFQYFQLSVPPQVQAGSLYTIEVTVPNNNTPWVYYATGNPYPGGQADVSSDWDYLFETYVQPATNGVILAANAGGMNGAVGIGTGTPQATLHVAGDVLANGNLQANGVATLTNANNLLAGNGAALTSLNAANLASGTLSDARLSANVALLNSANGFTNPANSFSGTYAGNGAGLTGLSAANIASGTLADARLSANVALLNGNQTFTGSNTMTGVALLTNANNLLAGNGAGLTSLNASSLIGPVPSASLTSVPAASLTGTLADARLSANVAWLNGNQTFVGSNTFSGVASFSNANNSLAGNGAALTALNAGSVVSGTLADARLSANVALRGSNNDFTGTNALNNQDLHMRSTADSNHGLGWYGPTKTFAGFGPDGPMLYGYSGGGLGTTINTQKLALTWNSAGNVGIGTTNPVSSLQVVGAVVATQFKGDGSGLTNLNASQLTGGTLSPAQLPSTVVVNGETGVTLSGSFSGSGAGLTSLSASNLNGALPPNTQVKFTGDQTNGFANSVILVDNTDTTTNAGPALRVQNDGGNTPFGALSVSANVSATAPNSLIAQFGNVTAWVCAITNDGSVYSAGDIYARGIKLTSDRNAKEKFTAIDSKVILDKVAALPMSEWDYKAAPGVHHLGPVAQDFHAAFGLDGGDDTHISVVDEGGVALAAIQGLNQKLDQTRAQLQERDAENADLRRRLEALEKLLQPAGQFPAESH